MSHFLPILLAVMAAIVGHSALADSGTTCNCGWVNKGRIVGGHETKKNEFPWMAALFNKYGKFVSCGAAIVTKYHAITAAHCRSSTESSGLVLLVGAHDIRDTKTGIMVPISTFKYNSNFEQRGVISDDIAIVITREEIPFSSTVGPVCMPSGNIDLENKYVKATGWGLVGWHKAESPVLKAIDIKVIPREQCKKHWALVEPPAQFCVMSNHTGPCEGDSGGPWVWSDPETKRYTLIGVTSYGGKCVYPPPAVNTAVGAYLDWIKAVIQDTNPQELCKKL